MGWYEHTREPIGSRRSALVEYPNLRLELWRLEPGHYEPGVFGCNEVATVIAGRTVTSRSLRGVVQQAYLEPGTSCTCPVGVFETDAVITDPIEVLFAQLPPQLLTQSALINYDIDPSKVELAYAGGLKDRVLHQILGAFLSTMRGDNDPLDRIFVDGMQAALAGHLLSRYTIDRWRAPAATPDLDPKRLKRVIDLIEMRFTESLSLPELAAEACLSEFHFSRLFRAATGLSPYRYVTERRVRAAQGILAHTDASLLKIALETGFGSQANFIRVFRKCTGLTPGQYRGLYRGKTSGDSSSFNPSL